MNSRSMPELPPLFLDRMQALLGDEYASFLGSYAQPAAAGLRANTLKLSPEAFQLISPYRLEPVPWCPAGFVYDLPQDNLAQASMPPGKHPYHAAGLYYLQDPSAMAAAELLAPQPGERILDLAAAPGGKSTHLAALMQNQGLLVSNEIHPRRVWELAENLERWGARQAAVVNETPARLAEAWPGFFDRVLVDAPCSGEGMFRRDPNARLEWSPGLVQSCTLRQGLILKEAARLVRAGGWLAYTTCTFNPEENEGVIAHFLDEHPDFEIAQAARFNGFASGRPEWIAGAGPSLRQAARLWPHRLRGEGHFVALLQRQDASSNSGQGRRTRRKGSAGHQRAPEAARQLYHDFCQELSLPESRGQVLALEGSYLYQLPAELPDRAGVKFIHPGLWLGVLKKNRFEPAHALAMSLQAGASNNRVSLAPFSDETGAYLRGESFANPGPDGWTLVCVDEFPLGWGKRVKGILKSHYPRGLRRV